MATLPAGGWREVGSPEHIVVNISTATDTELKAAVAGNQFVVLSYVLVAGGANNVTFKSGTTAISGQMNFGANGGVEATETDWGHMVTAVGEALNVTTSAGEQLGGTLVIQEITPIS